MGAIVGVRGEVLKEGMGWYGGLYILLYSTTGRSAADTEPC